MQQHILKRKHIKTELENIFNYPLTLAVAAMGYGKTTSVRDFLADGAFRYTWLTVDSDESSPQFIWDSLTSQLSKVKPELGAQLSAFGFPVDASQRDKILRIIEDLTYMTNSVLVIDDYHNVHSPEWDKLVERLVRANIQGFHILILSRTMPEISIDELRLKGCCYVIKSSVFEMNVSEIKEFFGLYGNNISDKAAEQIHDISEGWVSAVYLIMQEYDETGRISTGQSLERLIETSVMKKYTPTEERILKALCILDSFTPQQAVYVTNEQDAEDILRKISYFNSFIRYDKQEDVYRIHNVLGGYLQKRLEAEPSEISEKELYKRSGVWCVQNEHVLTGLKYLLKAEEYDLILGEFDKSISITRLMDSSPAYIIEIFERIPEETKLCHPISYLAYMGFFITNVDRDIGARRLSELEQHYERDRGLTADMQRRIRGEIELIGAYIAFNDVPLMHERFKKAYKLLEGHSAIANERKIITFGSPHSLYLYYRNAGGLLGVKESVQEMFQYYTELAGGCGRGFDDLLEAEYFLETGELDKAELYARRANHKAESLNQLSVSICAEFSIARVFAARGKFDEALEVMAELRDDVEAASGPILGSAFDVSFGYIGGITGCEDSFSQWLGEGDLAQSEILYQGMGFNYIAYGKYILFTGDFIKLEVVCEQMQQVFSQFHNMLGYLHMHILSAIARHRLYGIDSAMESIIPALEIGKADGIILPFAEYGEHILDILRELLKGGGVDEYLGRLLDGASCYVDNLRAFHGQKTEKPILTPREKEILVLVVEGRSNREIASELYIAEVTVRKNITAIYRKLHVTGRAAAVRRALEIKIL